jgi:hypothetical protein
MHPGAQVGSLIADAQTTCQASSEKNEDPQRAITFGDENQGLVKGLGKIAISPDHSIMQNGLQLSFYGYRCYCL